MRAIIFILLITSQIGVVQNLKAQHQDSLYPKNIDSLTVLLIGNHEISRADTIRIINNYNERFNTLFYRLQGDPDENFDTIIKILKVAQYLSEKTNYNYGKAIVYQNISLIKFNENNYHRRREDFGHKSYVDRLVDAIRKAHELKSNLLGDNLSHGLAYFLANPEEGFLQDVSVANFNSAITLYEQIIESSKTGKFFLSEIDLLNIYAGLANAYFQKLESNIYTVQTFNKLNYYTNDVQNILNNYKKIKTDFFFLNAKRLVAKCEQKIKLINDGSDIQQYIDKLNYLKFKFILIESNLDTNIPSKLLELRQVSSALLTGEIETFISSYYINQAKYDSASKYARLAIEHGDNLSQNYYTAGTLITKKKNWKTRCKYFLNALSNELYSTNVCTLNYQLGEVYTSQRNFDSAIYFYNQVILSNCSNKNILKNCYYKQATSYPSLENIDPSLETALRNLQNISNTINSFKTFLKLDSSFSRDTAAYIMTSFISEEREQNNIVLQKEKDAITMQRNLSILIGFLISTLILSTTYFVSKSFKNKKELEKEKLNSKIKETEKKFLESEMKFLRLRLHPHFIFNALSSVEYSLDDDNIADAKKYLRNFDNLLRRVFDNSGFSEISLEDELSIAKLYMDLEKVQKNIAFDYSIDVDKSIDPEEVNIPTFLLQPFLENAIKHGIKNKKDGFIKINITTHEEELICIVEDNGEGRKHNNQYNSKFKPEEKPCALEVIKQLLHFLSGIKKAKAAFEIEDLINNNNEPIGTRVKISIPLIL